MSQKSDAVLTAQAQVIRDETTDEANTAVRVGQMLIDLIDSKVNNSDVGGATLWSFAANSNNFPVAPKAGRQYLVTTARYNDGDTGHVPQWVTITAKVDGASTFADYAGV